MAEGYGAAAIGTYDSAFLGGDAYVRATLMAMASSRAAIGLRPSNPLTREPQIMASFLASLDSLTGGRAFLDVASGELRRFVNVYVNEEDVRFLQKLDTPLKDGDEVSIVSAIAGG